eukprot:RCo038919
MTTWMPPSALFKAKREEATLKDIFLSAIEGDQESIVHNLEMGVDINEVGWPSNGWGPFSKLPGFEATALHYAVGYGNKETVQLLLERGARTDIKTRSGFYAYEYAEHRGYQDILELLKKHEGNNDAPFIHKVYDD